MTAPRPILPGTTYLVTRRCTQRQFLLHPSPETRRIYEYCLAEAAARFDMLLIGWVAMSNHHHLVIHDQHGNVPAFLAHLHKMIAKVMNAHWNRNENLFSSEQVCLTKCVNVEDALDKTAYVLANPVNDNIVERADLWRGASSATYLAEEDGHIISRPNTFFGANSTMPATVVLRACTPPEWTFGAPAWQRALRSRVARAEGRARRALNPAGKQGQGDGEPDWRRRASTPEPRRSIRPFIACKEPLARRAALALLKAFQVAYRAARALFVAGDDQAIFPEGTYALRRLGARCQATSSAGSVCRAGPTLAAVVPS